MDVAIVAAARFPIREPFAGGMEAHTHALAERLWARGHDVTVYVAGGDGPYEVHAMLPVDFEASPAARRDVSSGPAAAVAEHHSYLDAVLEVCRRGHQIVHINVVHHLPFACAGLWPTSVVTATLHTPPTPWLESAPTLVCARRGLPAMVSVSHANARAWRGVPIERVIHNGVDLERWRPGPGGAGAVWWGRLVPEKAPHLAIDAARLAGMPITLMGPVHDADYFAREVQPRLGGDVHYAGHLKTVDVAAAVGRAAVAVVTPAWEEPFGLVVAEALACGTPVAAFDRGAIGELIGDATGRLAPAGDVERLAAAMTEAAAADRRACRRQAELRFSSDTMADGYESWFQTLVASLPGSGGMTMVVHHPAAHPFVENLWGRAPLPSPAVWDPPALATAGVGIVHLHFGFEQRSAVELAAWVAALRDTGISLVHTVHDLDNPHLVVQAGFRQSVATLVRAADAVTTLTRAAATVVERRTGRAPVVIPHPHVVPFAAMAAARHLRRRRRGIYVHAGPGRPNLDVDAIVRLATSHRRHPLLVHVRPNAPASTRRALDRLARAGRLELDVRPRLVDAELWSRLASAELLFLPYRWGTHSGLLEAAHDLGTPVLAPSCGAYHDQGAHTYGDDPSACVEEAIAGPPSITVASRRRDRRLARDRFASVHRAALRSASGAA